MTSSLGEHGQVVGGDLIVINVKRVQNAIGRQACNALLLEINQIGTITEAIDAVSASLVSQAAWPFPFVLFVFPGLREGVSLLSC